MKSNNTRLIIFLALAIILAIFYVKGGGEYLTLHFLQGKLTELQQHFLADPIKTSGLFFVVYVVVTALSFPGATVMTLLGGALFGPWIGVLIVSFASTLGSLLAFLISRFLLRDFLLNKFKHQFETIDSNISKDGPVYLATLRLVPVFPFFMINLVMGLTSLKAWTFIWVSQLAMLPGTFVYVYAGRKFSELTSLKGIVSTDILVAFTLLGILPFVGKAIADLLKRRKAFKGFKRPETYDYNMVAIGAGAAGLVTSYIGAAVKSKVALIEKHRMGGDCLNTGCVPSKALIKTAKILHLRNKASEYGLKTVNVEFNFDQVMERVQRVIREIEPHDSAARYEELGVTCIKGEARLISPWEIKVGDKIIKTKNITIATGAGPFIPKIDGIEQARYVTSDTIWNLRKLPQKFLVIGGGPIGCELAQAFGRLGSTVTILEEGTRLMSKEDQVVSELIENTFIQEGVQIKTKHKALAFFERGGQTYLRTESGGTTHEIEYDLALLAVGRKANTKGLGAEEMGVKLTEKGTIEVNEFQQTNFPNIFACGDVSGQFQLTHMAAHEAWYCAINGLFSPWIKFKTDYRVVPWCTYTDPEVATVGETTISATKKKLQFEVTEYALNDLDRAIADGEKEGFVRVITRKGSDQILGTTIVGTQASTMIMEFVSAMKNKKGLNSILGTIHVYPSLGEANKYAAGAWKKAHANPKILKFLEQYFTWKRG